MNPEVAQSCRLQDDYQLAGEENAWENTNSLDFERVVNSYSIATTREQLVRRGELSADAEDGGAFEKNGHFNVGSYQSISEKQRKTKKEHGHSKLHLHTPGGKVWTRWMLTMLVGTCCGLVAILILFCVQKIGSFRAERLNRQMQWATGHASEEEIDFFYEATRAFDKAARKFHLPLVFVEYTIYNLLLALTSSAMCLFFAPLAVGSGIPEVKAYLNGVCVPSFADFNVFVFKIFATILAVSSGLIIGPEGPL